MPTACLLSAGLVYCPQPFLCFALEHTLAYKLTGRKGEEKKWHAHAGSKTRQASLDSMPEDILHLIFGAAQLHTAAGEHKLPCIRCAAGEGWIPWGFWIAEDGSSNAECPP